MYAYMCTYVEPVMTVVETELTLQILESLNSHLEMAFIISTLLI